MGGDGCRANRLGLAVRQSSPELMGLQSLSPLEGPFPMESGGRGAFFPNSLNFQFVLFGLIKILSSKKPSDREWFTEGLPLRRKGMVTWAFSVPDSKWLFPFLHEKGALCIYLSLSEEPSCKSLLF